MLSKETNNYTRLVQTFWINTIQLLGEDVCKNLNVLLSLTPKTTFCTQPPPEKSINIWVTPRNLIQFD